MNNNNNVNFQQEYLHSKWNSWKKAIVAFATPQKTKTSRNTLFCLVKFLSNLILYYKKKTICSDIILIGCFPFPQNVNSINEKKWAFCQVWKVTNDFNYTKLMMDDYFPLCSFAIWFRDPLRGGLSSGPPMCPPEQHRWNPLGRIQDGDAGAAPPGGESGRHRRVVRDPAGHHVRRCRVERKFKFRALLWRFLNGFVCVFKAFVIAYTSDFIPRMVYKYKYSPHEDLVGYIDASLSVFNTSDYHEDMGGDLEDEDPPPTCQYRGECKQNGVAFIANFTVTSGTNSKST